MYRKSVSRRTDRGFFSRTAKKTKAINIGAYVKRGGVRL